MPLIQHDSFGDLIGFSGVIHVHMGEYTVMRRDNAH